MRQIFNRLKALLSRRLFVGKKNQEKERSQSNTKFGGVSMDRATTELLREIPTETTDAERAYLYQFFKTQWLGRYDVIEIGPYLGGTTRAIALGMMHNRRRSPKSKLLTFDRFCGYLDRQSLLETLEPVFRAGGLNRDLEREIDTYGNFRAVFDAFHREKEYSSILRAVTGVLPNSPEEISTVSNLFRIEQGRRFDGVFVDGCKSWFSTKFFMSEVAPCVEKGATFLFQDYGWYTCFWIPAFLGAFESHFKLISHKDDTYAYRLIEPLGREYLDRKFPDNPSGLGRSYFDHLFGRLLEGAKIRQDIHAQQFHSLQHAGALATLGYRKEAKTKIMELRARGVREDYRERVEDALVSPTYLPGENRIYL